MKHLLILLIVIFSACSNTPKPPKVEFKSYPEQKKIDVFVEGSLFTSFIYPDDMEKQVLYPIFTASGKDVTRGFPMNPRPFERTDHPHHVGLWLNFGDVNGLDFWNNSFAIAPENKHRYGSIKLREIAEMNNSEGRLVVYSDWADVDGNVLLTEKTTYLFEGDEFSRSIIRNTELTAAAEVTITENKEGLLGLRVDRAFEEPSQRPGRFLDASGNVTEVPVLNNDGVNGVYRNAEGYTAGDVWSKRSGWVALRADKEGEIVTLVILDHPKNPNYPAWSHARGYGLFAHNNFAGRAVDENSWEVKHELSAGDIITLRHQVIIGGDLSDDQINQLANKFSAAF